MLDYLNTFLGAYSGYASYLWYEITHPSWNNYFYWLIGVSIFFFAVEVLIPWRKNQAAFRRDFWMDVFYMFFNFFLFSLIIYNAASSVVVEFFHDALGLIGITNLVALNVQEWPTWAHLVLGFFVRDFIQWWIHRLLHYSPRLWEFHKVHHSVQEMGFAAHLRYHWMENVVYRSLEYIPLALIGIGLSDFFIIHIFTLAIGHYNHSNLSLPNSISSGIIWMLIGAFVVIQLDVTVFAQLGLVGAFALIGATAFSPFIKYIFNSPEMHIWHHSYELPEGRETGINFGLSLAIWDYVFGTAHVPYDGRDIQLGFPGVDEFPETFIQQELHGFNLNKDADS